MGAATGALVSFNLSQDPWDPATGPLTLSAPAQWSFAFDGKDSDGALLRNGVYLLVVESQGSSPQQRQLRILGAGQGRSALSAAPNPVRPGQTAVRLDWGGGAPVELKVYTLDGALVRDLGLASSPPLWWDLRTGQGAWTSNGIYVVTARVKGERSPQSFKLLVAR